MKNNITNRKVPQKQLKIDSFFSHKKDSSTKTQNSQISKLQTALLSIKADFNRRESSKRPIVIQIFSSSQQSIVQQQNSVKNQLLQQNSLPKWARLEKDEKLKEEMLLKINNQVIEDEQQQQYDIQESSPLSSYLQQDKSQSQQQPLQRAQPGLKDVFPQEIDGDEISSLESYEQHKEASLKVKQNLSIKRAPLQEQKAVTPMSQPPSQIEIVDVGIQVNLNNGKYFPQVVGMRMQNGEQVVDIVEFERVRTRSRKYVQKYQIHSLIDYYQRHINIFPTGNKFF